VSGHAELDNSATGLSLTLDVNCLAVTGTTSQKINGTVTASSSSSLVGANVVFHVEDNGRTPGDPVDRVSAAFITGSMCATFVIPTGHPGSLAPIDSGAPPDDHAFQLPVQPPASGRGRPRTTERNDRARAHRPATRSHWPLT